MSTGADALVVWVNAVDSLSRTNVDCQGIRVEFEDRHGDVWGEGTASWGGFDNRFWRVGHVFEAYPRSETELKLRIVPWRTNAPVSVTFSNPNVGIGANWVSEALPARQKIGMMEIVLNGLAVRTNGGPSRRWETASRYWLPEWRILSDGEPASGWREPEWTASDPFGNRGQALGIRQSVLKYFATFRPEVTNLAATERITPLPASPCSREATNTIWFQTNSVADKPIIAIGLMTATMTHFTDGKYDPNPPSRMGPTSGGAPTGWTATSRRISPTRVQTVRGHYADRPVIYLQCEDREIAGRLGVRLRDDQDRIWPTTREGNGPGIIPFMLDVPPEVKRVVPEIVLLNSIEAEFTIETPVAPP